MKLFSTSRHTFALSASNHSSTTLFDFALLFLLLSVFLVVVRGSPVEMADGSFAALDRRTQPFFPDEPSSCPICAKDYGSINSCAEAAPVLANFSMIIFNPGAFLDVIKCACTDTFQAVFPQCVDCFIRTNQSQVLNTPNLPAVVDGMRKICAIQSSLIGNVSETNGDVTPVPSPSPTSAGSSWNLSVSLLVVTAALITTAIGVGW